MALWCSHLCSGTKEVGFSAFDNSGTAVADCSGNLKSSDDNPTRYLRNLLTHTVNNLLQQLNYVKHVQYSVVKQKIHIFRNHV